LAAAVLHGHRLVGPAINRVVQGHTLVKEVPVGGHVVEDERPRDVGAHGVVGVGDLLGVDDPRYVGVGGPGRVDVDPVGPVPRLALGGDDVEVAVIVQVGHLEVQGRVRVGGGQARGQREDAGAVVVVDLLAGAAQPGDDQVQVAVVVVIEELAV